MKKLSNDPTVNPSSTEEMSPIIYKEKGKLAYISINTKMNAVNIENAKLLTKFLTQADENPKINVIIIKSEGDRIFSAGFDLNMFANGVTAQLTNDILVYGGSVSRTIFFCKKPVIAQIQGSAVGLGAIIALSSDFRFVARKEDLFFQLPEIDIKMFPATGPTAMAIKVLGIPHAQEMLLTGRKVFLDEFNRWGAITEIVEPDQLAKTVRKFAKNLAMKPSHLLFSIKSAINMIGFDQAKKWYELENKMARFNTDVLVNQNETSLEEFLKEMWATFTAGIMK